MSCTEVAIFEFHSQVTDPVDLNKKMIEDLKGGSAGTLIDYKVLRSPKDKNTFTWIITWVSAEDAKRTTDKWPTYKNSKAFSESVKKDIFYDFLNEV
jgi:hypothetical protein